LGLSQVYGIVQQSGGATEITSEVGRGTKVSLYLPKLGDGLGTAVGDETARVGDADSASACPVHDASVPTASDNRILLVDDDVDVRETISTLLREVGYDVAAVAKEVDAMRVMQSEAPPDLAVLDFAMSEGTGDKLAAAIRRVNSGMPIVFITGYERPGPLAGERWLLKKPFRAKELFDTVSEALHSKRDQASSLAATEPTT
jgi:CheY-like chemotaxis protein